MPRTLLLFLVLLLLPARSGAAPSSPIELVLRGTVADPSGRPVGGAKVTARTGRRSSVSAGRDGRFTLRVPLPTPDQVRAAPCTLQVFAGARHLRSVTTGGEASLTLAFAVETRPDRGPQLVVRSNDERIAAIAAALVAAGRGVDSADSVRFVALEGERVADPPAATMKHTVQVAFLQSPSGAGAMAGPAEPPARAESPAKTESPAKKTETPVKAAPPAKTETAVKADPPVKVAPGRIETPSARDTAKAGPAKPKPARGGRAKPAPVVVVHDPATGDSTRAASPTLTSPAPVTPAPSRTERPGSAKPADADCACRIKGTIELVMNPPPTEPVGVALWVEDMPATRDSVVIALGPPRSFELVNLPCGRHRLIVRSSSRRPYVVREPRDLAMPCAPGQLLQPRIVLRPK